MTKRKSLFQKKRPGIIILSTLILLLAIPLTVSQTQKQQNILSQAKEFFGAFRKEQPELTVSTNYPLYYLREKIVLRATNQSARTIQLQNSAPWSIERWDGEKRRWVGVFNPLSPSVLTPLGPGETKEWLWNQKDNKGHFVPSAQYRFNLTHSKSSYTTKFTITPKMGSEGYFTFNIVGETLRVYMSNPQSVRDAIDNFYGLNNKNIPNGVLVDDRPGKSPYDRQWSWHLAPESIVMAEAMIELCDGKPSDVERDLDYWLRSVRRFCPWLARVSGFE